MKKSALLKWINFWPPFLGAGIRVKKMTADMRYIEVEMKLSFWNKNYVGTHYGGSLYSMADPFFMLMLLENLGKDYIVWDKAATIRFENPGRGRVHALFELSQQEIDTLRSRVHQEGKIEPQFTVQIKDDTNQVIAIVEKTLYIRKKETKK